MPEHSKGHGQRAICYVNFSAMMTKTFLRLMALSLALVAPSVASAERIAAMTDPTRDYSLEGDVVTVWHDSFLFNDGSGQVIVDVRPRTTRDLQIAGRDYLQVVGRVNEEGVLRPVVIAESGREPIMFRGLALLEPLPLDEVMKNTTRYRLPRRAAAAPAPRSNDLQPAPAQNPRSMENAPSYASSGASPVGAAQPVGAGGGVPARGGAPAGAAPGSPAGSVPTPPPANPNAR